MSKLLMSRHPRGTDATKCGLDVLALHRRDHVRGRRIVGGQSVGIANLATCQQPLRSRGFVAISVDDADKRRRRLRLTLAGRALGGARKRGFRCLPPGPADDRLTCRNFAPTSIEDEAQFEL